MTTWLPCRSVGCVELVKSPGGHCQQHQRKRNNDYRAKRVAQGHHPLYDRRWERESKAFLRAHPLCMCEECSAPNSIPQQAEVVDHKVPHRGDQVLFWDAKNWQSMSKRHHDRKTATEDGGFGRESAHESIMREAQ